VNEVRPPGRLYTWTRGGARREIKFSDLLWDQRNDYRLRFHAMIKSANVLLKDEPRWLRTRVGALPPFRYKLEFNTKPRMSFSFHAHVFLDSEERSYLRVTGPVRINRGRRG
jgi:hypothetical protein